ncbi:MAG: type II secretion system F family protein [Puniceicoccales bacterium]|nr:type II secretion system F family protein [Puniceicoccales bacterium]
MKFRYKGLNSGGLVVRGEMEADSRKGAMQTLANGGIAVLLLREVSTDAPFKLNIFKRDDRVKFSDIEMGHFLRKLADLCCGGLLLADALESLCSNTSSGKERTLSERILAHLRDGNSFAQALKKCCNFFEDSTLSILELGDLTGKLSQALCNVVNLLQRKIETKKRFIAALSYPFFICCVAFVVILLFLFYLMPRMESMLRGFGGQLPPSAHILMNFSRFLAHYFPILLLLAAIAATLVRYFYRFDKYRLIFDRILLQLPVWGRLNALFTRARLSNTLASLMAGGVATSEAIGMAVDSISNAFFKKNYIKACDAILDGATLASAFRMHKIFDGSAADIIAVGEKTGGIAAQLFSLAAMYDEQLNNFLRKLIAAISSAALLFAFAIVAILALSLVSTVLNFSAKLAH